MKREVLSQQDLSKIINLLLQERETEQAFSDSSGGLLSENGYSDNSLWQIVLISQSHPCSNKVSTRFLLSDYS